MHTPGSRQVLLFFCYCSSSHCASNPPSSSRLLSVTLFVYLIHCLQSVALLGSRLTRHGGEYCIKILQCATVYTHIFQCFCIFITAGAAETAAIAVNRWNVSRNTAVECHQVPYPYLQFSGHYSLNHLHAHTKFVYVRKHSKMFHHA
jgi:hypothetical protein